MNRSSTLPRLFTVAALAFASVVIASSSESDDEMRQLMRKQSESEIQMLRLTDELRGSSSLPAWAGEFRHGDGMGVNKRMVIAPQGGFAATWHGCLGLYAFNTGTAILDGGAVRLAFNEKNDFAGVRAFGEKFIPVKWGDRRYLIAEDEMIEFVNGVNSGLEGGRDRSIGFLLNAEDEQKSARGVPELPAPYRSLLLAQPIRGKLTALLSGANPDRAKLNLGRKHGVFEGMTFHTQDAGLFGHAKVVHVLETESEVVVDLYGEKETAFIGQRFSSRYDETDSTQCKSACAGKGKK